MQELVFRFLLGGCIVTLFAMLGDVLRPKSFAGLFGAAPSVALATLSLTIVHQGKGFAVLEARTMIFGALAFSAYAAAVSWWLRRYEHHALPAAIGLLPIWFSLSAALLMLFRGIWG